MSIKEPVIQILIITINVTVPAFNFGRVNMKSHGLDNVCQTNEVNIPDTNELITVY